MGKKKALEGIRDSFGVVREKMIAGSGRKIYLESKFQANRFGAMHEYGSKRSGLRGIILPED